MDLSRYTSRMREIQEEAREKLQALRENGDLSTEAKTRQAAEIQTQLREAYIEERRRAGQQLEDERRDAYRRAHPVEEPSSDTQAEILKELRRGRVERDLFMEWERTGSGPRLADYEQAVARGDRERIEAYERYGPDRVPSEMGPEFTRRVRENQRERMPEEQRKAADDIAELEKAAFEFGVAASFMDRTTDELSRSGADGPTPERTAS